MILATALLYLMQEPASGAAVIDARLQAAWEARGLRPNKPAGDEEFLRRVTLDLTGVIPAAEEVERFAKDLKADKRARKIDELLASPAHAKHWAQIWTVALIGWFSDGNQTFSRDEFRDWLEEQFAKGTPWPRIAQALLSAGGDTVSNRAANFGVRFISEGAEAFTTRVAKTFLGIRLSCAQCHDHPFDVWTREDFYGMASFLARTQLSTLQRSGSDTYGLLDVSAGEGLQPEGFAAPVPARFLNGATPVTALWRQDLAVYLTRYPQFARAFVNRTWTTMMGRGIVHPPENFSRKNKPSHPDLLEDLTKDFVAHGQNVKHLLRSIANSKAYQLSSDNAGVKPGDEREFLTAIAKPLSPWQMFNSILRATGAEKDRAAEPARLASEREAFIAQFYDSLDSDTSAAQAYTETSQNLLVKMSGDYLGESDASEKNSLLTKIAKAAPSRKIDLLYLALLGRKPTSAERKTAQNYVDGRKVDDEMEPWRDLFYALIHSHEFSFNH